MKEIKSVEEFVSQVTEAEGKVLVDFWASWCGPCVALMPTVEKLDEELSDVTFVKVSVEEVPDLSQTFGIRTIPTLILFEDGELVGRITGTVPEEAIRRLIKNEDGEKENG